MIRDIHPTLHLKYHGLTQIMYAMTVIITVGAISFVYLTAENNILAQIFGGLNYLTFQPPAKCL